STGVLAIRTQDSTPKLYQFVFGSDKVSAIDSHKRLPVPNPIQSHLDGLPTFHPCCVSQLAVAGDVRHSEFAPAGQSSREPEELKFGGNPVLVNGT
ncbi:MAG TPA: hypothetical protein VF772_04010, partial [Terriglobales bacterium]